MRTNDEISITSLELRAFRAALRRLERSVTAMLQAQATCCGVTVAQCHVLLELDAAATSLAGTAGSVHKPEPNGSEPAVGNLAERLGLDISTLSRTVEQLVRAGLASRQADPANRRRQLVGLTAAGAARVAYIHAQCDQQYQQLLSDLPASQRILALQLLPRLADIMTGQFSEPGCGGSSCC